MTPAGERAYEENKHKSGLYAYEKPLAALSGRGRSACSARTRRPGPIGRSSPPGYRKVVLHWVTSAKKPETRAKRLATLIEDQRGRARESPATTSAEEAMITVTAPIWLWSEGKAGAGIS